MKTNSRRDRVRTSLCVENLEQLRLFTGGLAYFALPVPSQPAMKAEAEQLLTNLINTVGPTLPGIPASQLTNGTGFVTGVFRTIDTALSELGAEPHGYGSGALRI